MKSKLTTIDERSDNVKRPKLNPEQTKVRKDSIELKHEQDKESKEIPNSVIESLHSPIESIDIVDELEREPKPDKSLTVNLDDNVENNDKLNNETKSTEFTIKSSPILNQNQKENLKSINEIETKSSSKQLDDYFLAGKVTDFKPNTSIPIQIPNSPKRIVLINRKGTYYALQNSCPHQAAPLHCATISDIEDAHDRITCILHGWTFDLKTASTLNNKYTLHKYQVIISDDDVYVGLKPFNVDTAGIRHDFNGKELSYSPGIGWI
ncbi:Rieske [2Fe-2S] iron-sulfur domain-containing protein [Globomyces pollinis-pini]|nr:Rieske [2Fe-2S] iron-sulfur domain-containing protein [Globomyces pollinis-pini]